MSRTHSEGLEPGAWKIIVVAILGAFMSDVESTARAAHEHGYAVVLAEDAATSFSAEMYAFAFEHILPHLGRVAKADEIEL
jgi:nicotinamidase-related amidase